MFGIRLFIERYTGHPSYPQLFLYRNTDQPWVFATFTANLTSFFLQISTTSEHKMKYNAFQKQRLPSLRPYAAGEYAFKEPQHAHTATILTELPLYAVSQLKALIERADSKLGITR